MLLLDYLILFFGGFSVGMGVAIHLEKRREKKMQSALSLAQKQVLNTTAGKHAKRQIDRKLDILHKRITAKQAEHLEMFAAAYLKHTALPPDQVELVQETHGAQKISWRFVKRNDLH